MREDVRATVIGLNYSPEPTGIGPYTTAFAEHLASEGHHVTALVAHPHYPQWARLEGFNGWTSRSTSNGVDVRRLAHWIPRPPTGVRRLVSELTFGVRILFARWERPEVVVLVSPALFSTAIAMMRAVVARVPRVVWVQDLYSQGMRETGTGSGASARIVQAIEGFTFKRAQTVVAIHEAMAERVVSDLGVDKERVRTVANWTHIDPSDATPAQARRALGWAEDGLVVLHAGNMGHKQGLANVVDMARLADSEAPNLRVVLIGDGSERIALEARAKGVTSIEFLDPVDAAAFPLVLAAADILLVNELPGVKEMAVPSKLTSYLAAGRPVIAAGEPDGVVAEILAESGAGRRVASGDASELLAAVLGLGQDSEARGVASTAARRYWQRHLRSQTALNRWEQILDEVLRQSRG